MTQNRGVIGNIAVRPIAYLATFVVCFALTVGFLYVVDALPESSVVEVPANNSAATSTPVALEEPVQIVAPSIRLNETIENPESADLAVLDDALLRGAVRYPTSAKLGVNGTVFLFGHSSYIPIVSNQAYKAFNRIQDLKTGEIVSVYSATTEYRYKVTEVRVADAEEDVIELKTDGKYLVLVTCDSFTKKTSRFVVTAEFAGTYAR